MYIYIFIIFKISEKLNFPTTGTVPTLQVCYTAIGRFQKRHSENISASECFILQWTYYRNSCV